MPDATGSQHPKPYNRVRTYCERAGHCRKKGRVARLEARFSRPLGEPYPGHLGNRGPDGIPYAPSSDTGQVWSDVRYRGALLTVSQGVDVNAAYFLKAEVGTDG